MADWRDDCKTEIIWPETGTSHRPGGQYVGGGPNMIRVTHTPTNTVAQFGEHRSQHKNRTVCYEMLEWAELPTFDEAAISSLPKVKQP